MRLRSSRCSAYLALCLLCVSCSARAPQFASSASLVESDERRAPGVTEARTEQLPDPSRRGNSRDRVLLLRAPASSELARETVRDFLRAAVNEAPERMEPLLTREAFV